MFIRNTLIQIYEKFKNRIILLKDTRGRGIRNMRTISKRSKKGVSPVIATIIIVAIAIVMSISVAYWMLGLGASFTRFEKLEFVTAYAGKEQTGANNFTVVMTVKNTGSAPATIDTNATLLNGKPSTYYVGQNVTWYIYNGSQWNPITVFPTLEPGDQKDLKLWINGSSFQSGMTLEIMLHTATGKDYPKVVVLP